VREELYRQYPANGTTDKKKADARRKAFNRALDDSQALELIECRDVDGVHYVWLANGS
jgi:hypothetical protein